MRYSVLDFIQRSPCCIDGNLLVSCPVIAVALHFLYNPTPLLSLLLTDLLKKNTNYKKIEEGALLNTLIFYFKRPGISNLSLQ